MSHPTWEAYNELNREGTLNVEPFETQPRTITISTVALNLVQNLVEGLYRHYKNPIPSMCLYACPRWLITHCVQLARNGVTFPGSISLRLTYQYKLLLEHIEREKPPHETFREI